VVSLSNRAAPAETVAGSRQKEIVFVAE